MNKVTVKKKRDNVGDWFFQVYLNDGIVKSFLFFPDYNPLDKWSERWSFNEAMELAKRLELPDILQEEIVYQTPDPELDEIDEEMKKLNNP